MVLVGVRKVDIQQSHRSDDGDELERPRVVAVEVGIPLAHQRTGHFLLPLSRRVVEYSVANKSHALESAEEGHLRKSSVRSADLCQEVEAKKKVVVIAAGDDGAEEDNETFRQLGYMGSLGFCLRRFVRGIHPVMMLEEKLLCGRVFLRQQTDA